MNGTAAEMRQITAMSSTGGSGSRRIPAARPRRTGSPSGSPRSPQARPRTRPPISDLERPEGPPDLVIVHPPYGARLGDPSDLRRLYAALGQTLTSRFRGWRVGLVTTDQGLAHATGLPSAPSGPRSHTAA